MEEQRRRKSSAKAMYLLYVEGCCLLLLSTAVLVCGFIVNFHDDFDVDSVEAQFDYPQYWTGLTFLITSFVAIAAGTRQRNRWMVLSALILFLICILASLFVLVAEGNDWISHKNAIRKKSFWDSEDNYDCRSISQTCVCINSKTNEIKLISGDLDCDMLSRLNYIYGGILCCVLAGVFLALSSIVIVVIFIPLPHFMIPEPKRKIRKITVLEEKQEKPTPAVLYKPRPVEQPVVEEIVVREVKPKRRRTIVYDEPIPQVRPQPKRVLVPIEAPIETQSREQITSVAKLEGRETERMISHVYDEGRLVTQPARRPPQQPSLVFDERKYIVNPNFGKKSPRRSQVYRFAEASPINVRRQEPEYPEETVIQQRSLVYGEEPRVRKERRLVPVQQRSFVYAVERPRVYTMERSHTYAEEMPRILVRGRPRANSDEGPRVFMEGRRPVQTSERSRKYTGEMPRFVMQGRPRANSDGGPPEYSGAKPRVFKPEEFMPAARPATITQVQQLNPQGYNRQLETSLQTADKWMDRPETPY